MALTVTTPAQETNLVELARAEAEIPGLAENPYRDALIAEVSDFVESYIGWRLCRQTYSETVPGFGGLYLLVSQTPIVTVDSITQRSTPIIDHVISDPEVGEIYRRRGWAWTAGGVQELTSFPAPNSETPDYTIVYTAGYLLPGQTGRTLPPHFERAALELVRAIALQPDPGVASKRLGDWAISYRTDGDAAGICPPRVRSLLDPHRRAA